MSKSNLPKQVQEVKDILDRDPSDPRFGVAQKLINETPKHISMWKWEHYQFVKKSSRLK
jgi:hypothetical protein